MKFYTKIPKNPSNVSHTSSLTGEYQDYLEHGFVYDKLPAYKPKRGTLFQALSSIAGLKAAWNPGYFSPVVHNNIAYATNGRILAWIDLSLVDEAERMDEGIHFNPTLWTGDLDKTEMVEASIRRLAESSWGEFKQLLEKSGEADYVTRQFRIEHMPVLKKAGQSFYCLDEATQAIWAAVNIPVCPIVHVSSASLYTWMDAVYSLMPGKQFPAVTAHLSVPKESGRKNSIYLSVEGFEYNRLGALVYGTDHFPERLAYLWTDPDADSKAGGLAGVRSYIILTRRARRSCRLFGIPSAERSCVNCAYVDLLHYQPPCNNCLRSPYAVHGETTDDAWKPTGKWQIP